jgi:hypothetical protein
MSAAEALRVARAAGIQLEIDGEDLVLDAALAPPVAVLEALSCNKAGVIALLRASNVGWSAEDRRAFVDERAGIAEFDGGLSRAEAEAQAFVCCLDEWLNHHPVPSPPGRCLACGGVSRRMMHLCAMVLNRPSTPGCIRGAGRTGMLPERPRPGQHWPNWASRHHAPSCMLPTPPCQKWSARATTLLGALPAPNTRSRQRTGPKPSCCGLQPTSGLSATTCNASFRPVRGMRVGKVPVGGQRHFCRSREGLELVLGRLLGRDGVPAHVAALISTLPEWHQP